MSFLSIFKVILVLLIFLISFPIIALERNEILEKSIDILKLNEKALGYDTRQQVYEKYLEIKEEIKSDFISGNQHAAIDVYLLLDGLVEDNLQSLQALLATNNNELLEKELASALSYQDAQKLAFALKQNKTAFQTEFIIKNNEISKKCVYVVNGHELKNKKIFQTPSEIPVYVGAYCDDNTFEIKKIQSESLQKQYVIRFSDYNKIFFDKKNASSMPIPNPGHARYQSADQNSHDGDSEEMETDDFRKDSIETGIQGQQFFGTLEAENIYNAGFNSGMILTSYTKIQHGSFLAVIDFASVSRDYTTLRKNLNPELDSTTITQKQNGFFIRPAFGLEYDFFKNSNRFDLALDVLATMTILRTEAYGANMQTGFGVQTHFGPSLLLGKHFKASIQTSLGQDFGEIQGMSVGGVVTLGYVF
jgi:hypothetical protein